MAYGETSSSRGVSPWSNLSTDVLDVLVKKLTRASDYLRFRCVCRSWRSFAKPTNLPPHLPLLMLHCDPRDPRRFLSLPTWTIHTLFIPELVNKLTLASSRGWLLLLDPAPAGGRLFLLNPLTGAQIQLPSTDSFCHPSSFQFFQVHERFPSNRHGRGSRLGLLQYSRIFPWRAFLLLSPNLDPRDSVVVIAGCFDNFHEIAFCKLGDESWTVMNTDLHSMPVSVAYYEDSLFMTGINGSASVCKIASPLNPKRIDLPQINVEESDQFFVTTSTQLLLFARYHVNLIPRNADFDDKHFKHCFGVFKLELGNSPEWHMVEGIHDNVKYRSMELYQSFLVLGWAIPARRGDCIFYSEDSGLSYRQVKGDFLQTDAFNFETGSYSRIAPTRGSSPLENWLPPVWIELNLCKMLETNSDIHASVG